ncbi:type I restriction enzyme S subunit [Rhizobium sp. PP-F2F-G38]|nr:type I restriction enzyme S subunit [Rhizobium sp. PP-F2F-G38]
MSDTWQSFPLSDYLSQAFAGDWGSNPDPMNCVVYRSTDIDDVGNITGNGAERRLPIVKILRKQLVEGDILLEASGGGPDKPVGRSAIVDGIRASSPSTCSNFFRVLRPNKQKIDPKFLNHKLVWRYRQPEMLFFQQQTTGIINLKIKDFLAAPLSVPEDKEVQSKIAEVLDTLDAAIRGTEAVVAKLKAMKQGLLHDLLTRGIGANGVLRPTQPEAPHLYKRTSLGWVPKDWEETDVFCVSTTVTSGSRDWARYYSEDGAVFVRIGNLTREHVNLRLASLIYVRPPSNADGQRTSLEEGDVLVSITADLGIVGVIPADFGEAYINQHVALVRPNKKLINPRFLSHFLAAPLSQNHLSKLNDAGAKAGLNLPTIRGLPVLMPHTSEQDQIAERLDQIDGQIGNTQVEVSKLKSMRSGLMDDLLTGRATVTALL